MTALFLFFAIYSFDFFSTLNKAPFVRVPKNVLPKIIELLDIKDNSVVYDLGCGDSRVLTECYKYNSKAKYFGIEKAAIPYLLAKIKTRKTGVKILRGDFFKKDLSRATRIFLYLLPGTMDKLLPKLEKELKNDALVVSCSFKFTDKQPVKIVKDEKELFVYEFRQDKTKMGQEVK